MTLSQAKDVPGGGRALRRGSMAPKMEAVVRYLEGGGGEAIVTNPENVERALAGETGTRIVEGLSMHPRVDSRPSSRGCRRRSCTCISRARLSRS